MNPSEDLRAFFEGAIKSMAKIVYDLFSNTFQATDFSSTWWISVVGGDIRTHVGSAVTTVHHPGVLNQTVLLMLPIAVALIAIQVALSLFRQSTAGLIRAAAMTVLCVPVTYLLAGLIYTSMGIRDNLSMFFLEAGNGDTSGDQTMSSVMNLFGMSWDAGAKQPVMDESYQQWAMMKDDNNPGAVLTPLVIMGILVVLAFLLQISLVLSNAGLMLAAGLAGVIIMSQPLEAARGLAKGWGLMVLGLWVSKPMAAVILKFGLVLGAVNNSWQQLVAGWVVLVMACLALPMCVNFLTSHGVGGAGGLFQQSGNLGRSLMREGRQGAGRVQRGVGNTVRMLGRR